MTTSDDRQERSRLRAEEFQRRKRTRLVLFVTSLVVYVGVPILWYGGVEFGWVQPIHSPEFKNALHLGSLTIFLIILFLAPDFLLRSKSRKPEPGTKE